MSMKLSKREVIKNFKCYLVPNCSLHYLLERFEPVGHTEGLYGWNADVYIFGRYAIVTGDRPFGEPLPRDLIKTINGKARVLINDIAYPYTNSKYKEYCDKVADLISMGKILEAEKL